MNPMFYFLLALTVVLAVTADPGGPILDNDGYVIFSGSYWAIEAAKRELSCGGISSGKGSKRRFTTLPLRFSNWGSGARLVPKSENLNIKMDLPPTICGQSSYWWLTETEIKGWLFIAAGPKPKTGKDSSKSFFQIKKPGGLLRGYKFVYCGGDKSCYEFGMVVDRYGYSRLAPSNMPFRFVFVKAD
ncbi:unnamed protein product [Brassica oleracea]